MRIISTTDLSREGNDCYIHSTVTLMEDKQIYFVANHKVQGMIKKFQSLFFTPFCFFFKHLLNLSFF